MAALMWKNIHEAQGLTSKKKSHASFRLSGTPRDTL
jgi:hypothetical protein